MIHLKTTVWNGFTSWFLGLLPSLPESDISVYSTLSRCHLLCTQTPEGISKIHIWFCKSFFHHVPPFPSGSACDFQTLCDSAHLHPFWKELNIRKHLFLLTFSSTSHIEKSKVKVGGIKRNSFWPSIPVNFCEVHCKCSGLPEEKIHQINPFPWWIANNWQVKVRDCASTISEMKDTTGLGSQNKSRKIFFFLHTGWYIPKNPVSQRNCLVFYQGQKVCPRSRSSKQSLIIRSFGYYVHLAGTRIKSYFFYSFFNQIFLNDVKKF